MSETIRVPEPVYQRLKNEADEEDVSVGAIVRDWMEAHDRQASIRDDFRKQIETRGSTDE